MPKFIPESCFVVTPHNDRFYVKTFTDTFDFNTVETANRFVELRKTQLAKRFIIDTELN